MSDSVYIEVRSDSGSTLFSDERPAEQWLEQRALSGGVVWLGDLWGTRHVVLVQRDCGAPTNPGKWSYFSGAADTSAEVIRPPLLAREGSEELALIGCEGDVLVPMLPGALAARRAVRSHARLRFPAASAIKVRLCPSVERFHPHRLIVRKGDQQRECSTLAVVTGSALGRAKLELIWFGDLGDIGALRLQDAEVDASGRALDRRVISVSISELSAFRQNAPVTEHALAALDQLVPNG